MSCQLFVQESVIAVQQFQHASVFAHYVGETHLSFLAHRLAQSSIQLNLTVLGALAALVDHLLNFFLLLGCAFLLWNRLEFLEATEPMFQLPFLASISRQHHAFVDINTLEVPYLQPLAHEVID